MTDDRFYRHLVAALNALEREVPGHYSATVEALGELRIGVDLGDEDLVIRRVEERIRVFANAPLLDVSAHTETDHATLLALLSGEAALLDVLLDERLLLRGHVSDLVALERVLDRFLQGAVRAPSLSAIQRSYRRAVREI